MRFWSIFSLASATLLALTLAAPASAHQPVELGPSDSTPAKGPLLVDGTVSFAVYTDVRRGDRRGFRFRLEEGDRMAVQLLILDEPPSNKVRSSRLPRVTITDPQGRKTRMVINERTEFYEPYGGTNFLYLSRMESDAVPGEYRVSVSARSKREVEAVIAVGYREVRGEVRQGRWMRLDTLESHDAKINP
jgi:hypothetical protein